MNALINSIDYNINVLLKLTNMTLKYSGSFPALK